MECHPHRQSQFLCMLPNLESQAEDGRYPYAVSLKDDRGIHWCGGSLIAKDTVLTAA